MVYKVIEIVGTSPKGFAEAVENAVKEAGKTVRGISQVNDVRLSAKVEKNKITQFQATVKIRFEVKR